MNPRNILIRDYTYQLPQEKIALFPSSRRDASKLLVYKDAALTEDTFEHISKYIPASSLLVFNNTKVINARLLFKKPGGTIIEIFCLEPVENSGDYLANMSRKKNTRWKCLIGNAAKWKDEKLEKTVIWNGKEFLLLVKKTMNNNGFIVDFSWSPGECTFAEILDIMGQIPLPPYIKRPPVDDDSERYQTLYARQEGSVAAPTAGLHFTPGIFQSLDGNKIKQAYVTLHVGAGTFKPVTSETMHDHEMHHEFIQADLVTIRLLSEEKNIIAVGTTSLRTLESLYWLGVKILSEPGINDLFLSQWEVYESPLNDTNVTKKEALEALAGWMHQRKMENLFSHTQLLILPGYRFRMAYALITNFHQPQSTLLLLVAAAIGENWKKLYEYALENDFRFLSYGDANLIFMDGS